MLQNTVSTLFNDLSEYDLRHVQTNIVPM